MAHSFNFCVKFTFQIAVNVIWHALTQINLLRFVNNYFKYSKCVQFFFKKICQDSRGQNQGMQKDNDKP